MKEIEMDFVDKNGDVTDIDKEYKKAKIFGWIVAMASGLAISLTWGLGFREGYFKACKDVRDTVEDLDKSEDA